MRTEKIFAAIFLLGLIFKFFHLPGAGVILIVSLMLLSVMYFPLAFYFFCDKEIKRQNLALSIVSGMVFALVPMGILFKLMYWPPVNDIYLLLCIFCMPVFFGIVFWFKRKSSDELKGYYKNMFVRTSTLTFLTVFFYLVSRETLIKIQHRDNPELAKLKIQCYMNPGNEEFERQLDAYLMKSDSLMLQKLMKEDSLYLNGKK